MMNLRSLQYLVALASHRHFGKAAQASFVSQPTLSMQIKKLEEELNVKLLERTNKKTSLTPIGHELAQTAQRILLLADEMKKAAKAVQDPYQGEIRIGLIPTLAPYLLPQIMPRLRKQYPKLSILLSEEKSAQLFQQLEQGTLDLVIAAQHDKASGFVEMPLFTEEFFLAVPKQHPLAKYKTVKSTDLANETLLLLEEGHCLRMHALEVCKNIKSIEQRNFEATSLETLRHMVASNIGITLMPALAQQKNDGITYIPFSKPKPTRTIALFWRKGSVQETLFNEFVKLLTF